MRTFLIVVLAAGVAAAQACSRPAAAQSQPPVSATIPLHHAETAQVMSLLEGSGAMIVGVGGGRQFLVVSGTPAQVDAVKNAVGAADVAQENTADGQVKATIRPV